MMTKDAANFNNQDKALSLWCSNVRIAFTALSLIFWIFSAVMFFAIAAHSDHPELSKFARATNDWFGNTIAFMIAPIILVGTMMYFLVFRKTIKWHNGLVINEDSPINIEYYQIKRFSSDINLIYLKAGSTVWILHPGTSEDLKKFKNVEVVNQEKAINAAQVDLLRQKLIASGATEKHFWLITKNVTISVITWILIMAWAFSDI